MADPLSITAGAAGLLSLGLQTSEALVKFYTLYRDRDVNISSTIKKLEGLLTTFHALETAIQRRHFRPDEKDLVHRIEAAIQQCDELIQELQDECQKLNKTSPDSIQGNIKAFGRRIAYPFRESTLKRLDEDVNEIRDGLSLALDVLQVHDNETTLNEIDEVKSLINLMRAAQISSTVQEWLAAPDVAVNHAAQCAKRHPGTGVWFVQSAAYKAWLIRSNSFLWLNGFAGCGKSVLCSTAIQYTYRRRKPGVGIAIFYFTFSDGSKQDDSAMLRALILQLSEQIPGGHTYLNRLRESHKSGLSTAALAEHLRYLIQKFDQVYLFVDALDESPRHKKRDRVMEMIQTVRNWALQGVHLMLTSRDEPNIREWLMPAPDEEVLLNNDEIIEDIRNFVNGQLTTNPTLRKWHAHHSFIQKELTTRAHGVFRWVECQFEALKRCPRSERHLETCLKSLPRSLDETYERMLTCINDESAEEARRILTLLCFSARPLTVTELLDAMAIRLTDPIGLDHRSRLQDEESLHEICPGMIDFALISESSLGYGMRLFGGENRMVRTVRIAHFSVQEYLQSNRIFNRRAAKYALSYVTAQTEVARVCCVYLLEPELPQVVRNEREDQSFPFAGYAAEFWHHHYDSAGNRELDPLVLELFKTEACFSTWIRLRNPEQLPEYKHVQRWSNIVCDGAGPALYYASLLGLPRTLQDLISIAITSGTDMKSFIDAPYGVYGSALQAASFGGHNQKITASLADYEETVNILLDVGANVNAESGKYGCALQTASYRGNENVVRILLGHGAEVNTQRGYYGNALHAASHKGKVRIVQMLIDAGADVNSSGEIFNNPLQAAAAGDHEKLVKILIGAGADVNTQGRQFGSLANPAIERGDWRLLRQLLGTGPSKSADPERDGSALYQASTCGNEAMVKMLLDAGADVHTLGGTFSHALGAASSWGHYTVVKMLLDAGAEVNATVKYSGDALRATILKHGFFGRRITTDKCVKVVQTLINAGANVNASGGERGSALRLAVLRGDAKVVRILLRAGAELRPQDRELATEQELIVKFKDDLGTERDQSIEQESDSEADLEGMLQSLLETEAIHAEDS